MEYFLDHIIYIIIAGLVIGAICCVWAFAAARWEEQKKAEGESNGDGWSCSMGCSGCVLSGNCGKQENNHTSAPVH